MSTERNQLRLEFGPIAATGAEAARIPEITVSATDAPCRARSDEVGRAATGEPRKLPLPKAAARAAFAVAGYVMAGFVGWRLYDYAGPVHMDLSNLFGAATAQKSAEQTELLRLTQKLSTDIRALETRIDAIERARDAETRSAMDEVRAGFDAKIGSLAGQLEAMRREAEARAAESRAASDRTAEKRAEGDHARKGAAVEAHVRPGWTRERRRGDAFDPSLHPNAPGAPRPLGPAER